MDIKGLREKILKRWERSQISDVEKSILLTLAIDEFIEECMRNIDESAKTVSQSPAIGIRPE